MNRFYLALALLLILSCARANIRGDPALPRKLATQTEWNQIGGDIDGQAAGDRSGWSVDISDSGSRVVVSAPSNDLGGSSAGLVRVFEFQSSTSTWSRLGSAIQGEQDDGFGYSVSISGDGNTIAVGSIRAFPYAGKVKILRYQSNTWTTVGSLNEEQAQYARDRFGGSVSLNFDGTRIAVGAAYHPWSEQRDSGPGATYIFEQLTGQNQWEQIGKISGTVNGEKSGHAVSLNADGTVVVIGEREADPTSALVNAGTTVVYYESSSLVGWQKVGSDIPGVAAGEQSGYSVDISDDGFVVAIGSPLHSSQANEGGMVRVFNFDTATNSWVQMGSNIFPTNASARTKFGQSVSLSSDGLILAVGEPNENGVGMASVYYFSSTSWSRDTTLSAGAASDRFGFAVALSGVGTRLAVGAYNADQVGADSGKTRVYEFQTSGWTLEVENFEANFGTDANEIELTYVGIAPEAKSGRTYRTTMLLGTCLIGAATSAAITPVEPTGSVPATEAFRLLIPLRVNMDTIKSSGFYGDDGNGMGNIGFCIKLEILEGTEVKAERLADVSLDLDMGQDFLVTDFISKDPSTGKTDVKDRTQFDYEFESFFCDENKVEIGGSSSRSVPPGGEVSVCLKAKEDEPVIVSNVKSVSFENRLAPLLGVPLIDANGNPLEGSTVKECSGGICRVAATTVPRLYEVESGGTVRDVTAGVSMAGTVTFTFPDRRLNDEEATLETNFRVKLDLTTPPDRTSSRESSPAASRYSSFAVATLGGLLLWFRLL